MPLFEYICKDCKAQFEMLRPASQADCATCPECGSTEVSRLLSRFSTSSASFGNRTVAASSSSGSG